MGTELATANIFQLLGVEKNKKQLGALAGKYMTADRVLALCVNAVRKTPRLAECDPQSVLGAMMSSAGLGLEPNTPTQQAWLIPYAKNVKQGNQWVKSYECQFQIGYRGFITLAYRSPIVESIDAEAIHENDHFKHMKGSKSFLEFEMALKDRGALIGAFCHVKLKDGAEVAVVLPLEQIYKAREKSETFKSLRAAIESAGNEKDRAKAQKKFDETPWVDSEDEMAAKTAIRRVAKRLPLSSNDPLAIAVAMEEKTIDLSAMTDGDLARGVFENGYEPPIFNGDDEVDPGDKSSGETRPTCTADDFEAKRAEWRQLVIGKKKTPSQLIAMIQTKQTLTDDQKLTIDSWAHEND